MMLVPCTTSWSRELRGIRYSGATGRGPGGCKGKWAPGVDIDPLAPILIG
jgi:hypothetical protein